MKLTGGGADYSFECIGSPQVMRQAFECTNAAWGTSYVIGVAPHGAEVSAIPGQPDDGPALDRLLHGRRAPRPPAGDRRLVRRQKIDLDSLVTHRLPLEQISEGFELMKSGESIRSR